MRWKIFPSRVFGQKGQRSRSTRLVSFSKSWMRYCRQEIGSRRCGQRVSIARLVYRVGYPAAGAAYAHIHVKIGGCGRPTIWYLWGHGIFEVEYLKKRCVLRTKLLQDTIIGNHTYRMEWYHVWRPWLTCKLVARFVSDSWVSCSCSFVAYSAPANIPKVKCRL